jgi:ADP-ribose pyrophosphatase YjhB (NUDIX family)
MKKFKRWSGVILKKNDKVLLCKRSPDKSLPNVWSIPSGKIENGEIPLDAALREFKEETDIQLPKKLDLIGLINKYKQDGKTKRGLIFVYYLDSKKELIPDLENAQDGFEHSECGYFSLENLPLNKNNTQLEKIIKKVLK